jgi:hypothetical protein
MISTRSPASQKNQLTNRKKNERDKNGEDNKVNEQQHNITRGERDNAQQREKEKLTNNSFGVLLFSISFSKHPSTNSSTSPPNFPAGRRGEGSLTIWCISSMMLIVMPPPCSDTPLLRRRLRRFVAGVRGTCRESRWWCGAFSRSELSSSESEKESEKGNWPTESSMRVMPRDQMSDLTE